MADKLAFLLFGDQSLDTHAFLAEFFRQEHQGLLAKAFLEQAGHALRKEVERLPKLERTRLPMFLTLQQLNERYHSQTRKHPGIDGALLCISQLAHYIEYVCSPSLPLPRGENGSLAGCGGTDSLSSSHAEKNWEDVTGHDRTHLVGLCSGLFAASAIACTPSLSTLVPVAVQVVLMAFRTGFYVAALAERLSPSSEKSESWTYIFPNMKEDEAEATLAEFHSSNVSLAGPRAR